MKNMMHFRMLPLFICGVLAVAAQAGRAELTVGDSAPRLQTGNWVQGEPVRDFDPQHVYIVEFWATWCGPCRASIPHLNQLFQAFKDKGVIVIGQDVWDQDEGVAKFVKQMGDQMTYRVALDDKSGDSEGSMASHWWKRGVNHHGIPTAFVIKDHRIAWIGHPMTLTEQKIDGILSPGFDFNNAAAEYKTELKKEDEFQALQDEMHKSLEAGKWDDASTALDKMAQIVPEDRRKYFGADTRVRILLGQKKYDEADQLAQAYCDSAPQAYDQRNAMAWTMLTQKNVDPESVKLALKLAGQANEGTAGTNAMILDTLARAQFMTGKTSQAITTEARAAERSQGGEKKQLEKTLADYRAGKLPAE